jgi:hypothetical protein
MSLSDYLKKHLNEIATGEMPALTRAQRKRGFQYGPWQRFHADEDGKISFVSVFTVLIMLIFILLVANAGIGVKEKVELQNAADATAYSSALWQARSLNAITTTNHLMGELTAITVILDSFGGEMLGSYSGKYSSDESKQMYEQLYQHSDGYVTDLPPGSTTITSSYLSSIDKQLVGFLVGIQKENSKGLMTRSEGKHEAGATIYDAKLTLQFWTFVALWIKDKANRGLDIAAVLEKTPFAALGYGIEAVSAGVHVFLSTAYLPRLGAEWAYLEAVESVIKVVNVDGAARRAICSGVVPALSIYNDTVVGSKIGNKLDNATAPFNQSVRDTQKFMLTNHKLNAAETSPSWKDMRLPVVVEEQPVVEKLSHSQASGFGSWEYPPSEWSGDFTSGELEPVRKQYKRIREQAEKIKDFLEPLKDAAEAIEKANEYLVDAVPIPDELKEAVNALNGISQLLDELALDLPKEPDSKGYDSNPCRSDEFEKEEYRLNKFYWQSERKSQWVRATYPYVDEYRAPIVKFFKSNCRLSDAATYYAHWTNRYTLSNSWEIRKDNDKKESADESKNKNLFAKLKAEVGKLRARFEKATDDTEEENAGTVNTGKFVSISRDLNDLVNSKLKSEIESLQAKVPWVKEWLAKVREHKELSESLGKSVTPSADLGIEPKAAQGIAEEMALINLLDDLLTILEDFLDAFEFGSPHMYVLKGMEPGGKGISEPWIENNEMAEELFVVNAIVSRPTPTLMGAIFDKNTPKVDRYAVACAMVYNANGRNMTSQKSSHQPNTGWDTLNWAPPVRAGEWGNHKPSDSSNRLPWQLTTPNRLTEPNQVKLNWQVKLVPMTGKGIKALSDKGLSMWAKEHAATIHH